MQTMNISLPETMKQFVEEQVVAAKAELEQLLLSSINSGDAIDLTPEMIEDVRHRLRARAAQREPAKQ
jgi:hypothetical protein